MASFAQGRVLDVGFADRHNSYLKGVVVGFDRQRVCIPSNYDSAVVGDVNEFSFTPESFDTVIAGEIIEHLEKPVRFLRGCYRLLRPNGRLILSTPNPYYPPYIILNWLLIRKYFYAEEHLFAFTPRLLMRLCERAGFHIEGVFSGGIVLPFLRLSAPFPRFICYHMIYVCRK